MSHLAIDVARLRSLAMQSNSLLALLEAAANNHPSNGLIIATHGNIQRPTRVNYPDLRSQAQRRRRLVQSIEGFRVGKPILIYLDDNLDTFFWFWATLYANAVPVLTSSFSNIAEQRQRQIQGLASVLLHPICITNKKLLGSFGGQDGLTLRTIESLQLRNDEYVLGLCNGYQNDQKGDDLAILMLTSGSTGTPKAVRLNHSQILSAVAGKISFRERPIDANKPFLNWIGLDHVACITEIHLTAMFLGVDQIHAYPSDMISEPLDFLTLLSQYQVSRTFAPNFFLAKLLAAIQSQPSGRPAEVLDLSNLKWLGSGGEANDVAICKKLSELLALRGAASDVIVPGFGMTETCAGIVYNAECPGKDVRNQRTFTSLGRCISGVEMRVTRPSDRDSGSVSITMPYELGSLEVYGSAIFDGYYNNVEATADAFTQDGWFKTGDQATIDSEGNLNLIGRVKETMNINGVKHLPQDIEILIEQALATRRLTRVVCFPYRPPQSQTEHVCLTYVTECSPIEEEELVAIHDKVVQLVMLHTGVIPQVLGLSDESQLPISTLGKVSRARMRTMLEGGHFAEQTEAQRQRIRNRRAKNITKMQPAANEAENLFLEDFQLALGIGTSTWGINTPIFELGVTSIDLILLKKRIGDRLGIDVPIATLMHNPTPRSMARALQGSNTSKAYDAVVPLRKGGAKTPLWLVHPGVGEVLVFLGLSQHIKDRPVYALRARGFDGEPYFSSINETVNVYLEAIIRTQPTGPYALAGYSFGTMLAFEIAKRLESVDQEVRFLGSFNLPPHIRWRMRQLDWPACLLHLCYFLDLMPESRADALAPELRSRHDGNSDDEDIFRECALSTVLRNLDQQRMANLSLGAATLMNWADLTYSMQSMAVEYEPGGSVAVMDVFYANPLRVSARSKEEWLEQHLSKWADFVRTQPLFHEVGGAHYTMLNPDHVQDFARTLAKVLEVRGV